MPRRCITKLLTATVVSILVTVASCKDNEPVLDFFGKACLVGDSTNLLLRMKQPQTILTNKGEMGIYFLASELCSQDECPTCDVNAAIDVFLLHSTDTVKINSIRIYRCGQFPPILYKTVGCDQSDFGASGYHFTKYGKILYNVNELYPYPKTRSELNDLIQNNAYYIKLTALNTCIE
jgi:hypothetical protein